MKPWVKELITLVRRQYNDSDSDYEERLKAYNEAWRKMYTRYPELLNAQVDPRFDEDY